jgi:hypothetical protein
MKDLKLKILDKVTVFVKTVERFIHGSRRGYSKK